MTLFGRITNASPQGAFIRTSTPLQRGDRARLVWTTPNGDRTVIVAEVAWVSDGCTGSEPGLGLRLLRFEAGEDLWQALIEQNEPTTYEN